MVTSDGGPDERDPRPTEAAPGEQAAAAGRQAAGPGGQAPTHGDSRRLAKPPSTRYASRTAPAVGVGSAGSSTPSALPGPLARAGLVALAGAVLLTVVGAVLASTAGLLFVAGATGASVGLVLARAAVPQGDARPVTRTEVARIAACLALAAVLAAAVATWAYARGEGGTLGLVEYLLQTFGPFVPAEAGLSALAAWWGASIGPVQS